MFDNIRADYQAHGRRASAQGFWVLVVYRFGRWRYGVRPRLLRMPLSFVYHVLFKLTQIIAGVELPCEVQIGKNFVIDHFGGIVISGYARFGDNCRVRTGVVVGLKNVDNPTAPTSATTSTSAPAPRCWGRSGSATGWSSAPTRWCSRTCPAITSPSAFPR